MKDLKYILVEGVLDNIEKTLSKDEIANMCPPPGNKKWFKVSYDNSIWLVWDCKTLIKPLLERLPRIGDKYFKIEDCVGISAKISTDNCLDLYLATDWSRCGTSLKGFTQYFNSKPEAKKMAINIFKHLSKNYSALEKLLTIATQKRNEWENNAFISAGITGLDCIDFKEILKY